MKIFIIGMPGSGKTVLGEQLASLLKIPFYDLDDGVERETGMSIAELFDNHGEKHFRTIESRLLRRFPQMTGHFILSTGGGAPCFFDNMGFMNEEGRTVFLKVPVIKLTERLIENGLDDRPLLKDKNKEELEAYLENQLDQRLIHYEKAALTVEASDITAKDLFDEIKKMGW